MKKFTSLVSVLLLVCILTASLVSCSSYSSLLKAFEKEGYSESEAVENLAKTWKEKLEKDELAVTVHVVSKDAFHSAAIFEFKSTSELKKAYDENETVKSLMDTIANDKNLQNAYDFLEEKGLAKGNCLVLPLLSVNVTEITDIVKKA